MVFAIIDGVDSESIDAQFGESVIVPMVSPALRQSKQVNPLGNISCAGSAVSEWVVNIGGTSWLIIDSSNVKPVVTGEEGCKWVSATAPPQAQRVHAPFPLIVIAGKDDALGASAPAKAPVTATATISGAISLNSFIMIM